MTDVPPTTSTAPRALGRALLPPTTLGPIAVGGAIGALARYGVTRAWPVVPGQFPWSTWMVNTTGGFCLGLVLGAVTLGAQIHPRRRAFVATGVLGAFTTFSTWAVDVDRLSGHHHVGLALVDVVGSIAVGLVALVAGAAIVRSRHRHRITR